MSSGDVSGAEGSRAARRYPPYLGLISLPEWFYTTLPVALASLFFSFFVRAAFQLRLGPLMSAAAATAAAASTPHSNSTSSPTHGRGHFILHGERAWKHYHNAEYLLLSGGGAATVSNGEFSLPQHSNASFEEWLDTRRWYPFGYYPGQFDSFDFFPRFIAAAYKLTLLVCGRLPFLTPALFSYAAGGDNNSNSSSGNNTNSGVVSLQDFCALLPPLLAVVATAAIAGLVYTLATGTAAATGGAASEGEEENDDRETTAGTHTGAVAGAALCAVTAAFTPSSLLKTMAATLHAEALAVPLMLLALLCWLRALHGWHAALHLSPPPPLWGRRRLRARALPLLFAVTAGVLLSLCARTWQPAALFLVALVVAHAAALTLADWSSNRPVFSAAPDCALRRRRRERLLRRAMRAAAPEAVAAEERKIAERQRVIAFSGGTALYISLRLMLLGFACAHSTFVCGAISSILSVLSGPRSSGTALAGGPRAPPPLLERLFRMRADFWLYAAPLFIASAALRFMDRADTMAELRALQRRLAAGGGGNTNAGAGGEEGEDGEEAGEVTAGQRSLFRLASLALMAVFIFLFRKLSRTRLLASGIPYVSVIFNALSNGGGGFSGVWRKVRLLQGKMAEASVVPYDYAGNIRNYQAGREDGKLLSVDALTRSIYLPESAWRFTYCLEYHHIVYFGWSAGIVLLIATMQAATRPYLARRDVFTLASSGDAQETSNDTDGEGEGATAENRRQQQQKRRRQTEEASAAAVRGFIALSSALFFGVLSGLSLFLLYYVPGTHVIVLTWPTAAAVCAYAVGLSVERLAPLFFWDATRLAADARWIQRRIDGLDAASGAAGGAEKENQNAKKKKKGDREVGEALAGVDPLRPVKKQWYVFMSGINELRGKNPFFGALALTTPFLFYFAVVMITGFAQDAVGSSFDFGQSALAHFDMPRRLPTYAGSPAAAAASGEEEDGVAWVDDHYRALEWVRDHTPADARVLAWWDYGYQITGIARRTSLADGNTWNHEHIATIGKLLTSPVAEAHALVRHLADYVLVFDQDRHRVGTMARVADGAYHARRRQRLLLSSSHSQLRNGGGSDGSDKNKEAEERKFAAGAGGGVCAVTDPGCTAFDYEPASPSPASDGEASNGGGGGGAGEADIFTNSINNHHQSTNGRHRGGPSPALRRTLVFALLEYDPAAVRAGATEATNASATQESDKGSAKEAGTAAGSKRRRRGAASRQSGSQGKTGASSSTATAAAGLGPKQLARMKALAERFELVYTSHYGLARVYKVLNVSAESKAWVADPANWVCDARERWMCRGQYPPAPELQAMLADYVPLDDDEA